MDIQEYEHGKVGSFTRNNKYIRNLKQKKGHATKDTMPQVTTEQATAYLFKFMRVQGLIMPQRYQIPYVIYSLITNCLSGIFFPLAFTLSYFKASHLEIGLLLTSMQVAVDSYSGTLKIGIIALRMHKLMAANALLKKLDMRIQKQDEIAELQKLIVLGRRIVVVFYAAYVSYATSTFIGAYMMGRPLYSLYLPFLDWRRSRPEFLAASWFEYFLISLACIQQTVNDGYGVIYLCVLRTHMKILLLRVQKLGSNHELNLDQQYEELKLCIKDHKNLLSLFNVIAPIISLTIFVQFMVTAIALGTTLINITIFTLEFSSRVGSCFYILAVVLQIFPLCYIAQSLIDDSDRLSEVIFHSKWVDQDKRFRKMIIFFMHRSQRPMEVNAAKFIPITLSSFLSIAKFSFTLFTFIQKMGIKERLGKNE